jgi:AbiV family abortive infection protein
MSSNYRLKEKDIKEGMHLCYQKINSLLDCAEVLVNRGEREISSGLYTYAVEEMGKLFLLQDALQKKKNSDGTIAIDPDIFGKGSGHTKKKFKRFHKNHATIPTICKKLRYVKGAVSTGHSVNALFGTRPVDFSLRKQILYTDWVRKKWLRHVDIEISDLKQAITHLKKWTLSNIVTP